MAIAFVPGVVGGARLLLGSGAVNVVESWLMPLGYLLIAGVASSGVFARRAIQAGNAASLLVGSGLLHVVAGGSLSCSVLPFCYDCSNRSRKSLELPATGRPI